MWTTQPASQPGSQPDPTAAAAAAAAFQPLPNYGAGGLDEGKLAAGSLALKSSGNAAGI